MDPLGYHQWWALPGGVREEVMKVLPGGVRGEGGGWEGPPRWGKGGDEEEREVAHANSAKWTTPQNVHIHGITFDSL